MSVIASDSTLSEEKIASGKYSQEVIVFPFSVRVYPSSRCQVQTLVVTESESNVFLCNRFARNASTLYD